jgi:hypothetical protein
MVVEVPVNSAVGLAQLKLLLMVALALVMVFDRIEKKNDLQLKEVGDFEA